MVTYVREFSHPTDKLGHGYGPFYEHLADLLDAQFRRHPLNVLEIGIGSGEGMSYFCDLFGRCFGVDIDAQHVDQVRAAGFQAICCSQESAELPTAVLQQSGFGMHDFDVIVDDASHDPFKTAMTLSRMWQLVRAGGAYVIEDWNHIDGHAMWTQISPLWLYRMMYHHRGRVPKPILPDVKEVRVLPEGLIVLRKDVNR